MGSNISNAMLLRAQLRILTANYTWQILVMTAVLLIGLLFVVVGLFKMIEYIKTFKAQIVEKAKMEKAAMPTQMGIDGVMPQVQLAPIEENSTAKKAKFGFFFYLMLAVEVIGIVLIIFAITQYTNDYLKQLHSSISEIKTMLQSIEANP